MLLLIKLYSQELQVCNGCNYYYCFSVQLPLVGVLFFHKYINTKIRCFVKVH